MKPEVKRYSELDPNTREILTKLVNREFGDVPIVQEYKWATPDWAVTVKEKNDIACIAHVVERICSFDDVEVFTGGLNNLITPEKYRGRGLAGKVLERIDELIFNELQCDAGLLLCADSLVPFYQKYDWYPVSSRLLFDQPGGKKEWQANVMLKMAKNTIHPSVIDVNGLPW